MADCVCLNLRQDQAEFTEVVRPIHRPSQWISSNLFGEANRSDGLQPNGHGLQASSDGLQPRHDGLQPTSSSLCKVACPPIHQTPRYTDHDYIKQKYNSPLANLDILNSPTRSELMEKGSVCSRETKGVGTPFFDAGRCRTILLSVARDQVRWRSAHQ